LTTAKSIFRWPLLYSLGAGGTENTAFNSSIVASIYFAAGACLPSRCLAIASDSGSDITLLDVLINEKLLIYGLEKKVFVYRKKYKFNLY
jgi:hypothetical protein